jgi:hypothetical protein
MCKGSDPIAFTRSRAERFTSREGSEGFEMTSVTFRTVGRL